MIKKDIPIKKILLIYAQLRVGGIETLILKMCKWLSANGYEITLFIYGGGGELSEEISKLKNVKLIINKGLLKIDTKPKKIIDMLLVGFKLPYYMSRYSKSDEYDLIFSFTPESFLMSYLFKGKVTLSGIYHTPLYSHNNQQSIIRMIKEIDKNFATKIVSSTPGVKSKTETILKQEISNFIFPLPIDFKESTNMKMGNYHSQKIVSVGRIEEFKTYIFYMIDVMENLIKKFPNLEYHIYGYGSAENKLLRKINKSPARNNVYFHGSLGYRDFPKVLNNTFCFIGSGSSLVEAAYLGVPSIVSVNYINEPKTPGFIYEIPMFETGDMENIELIYKVEDIITKLLSSKENKYKEICMRCYQHVKPLNIDEVMTKFIKNVKKYGYTDNKAIKLTMFNFLTFFLKQKIKQIRSTKYLSS